MPGSGEWRRREEQAINFSLYTVDPVWPRSEPRAGAAKIKGFMLLLEGAAVVDHCLGTVRVMLDWFSR